MKTALVLSGGGANGSFQVGALKKLLERGLSFDVIAGVSVGSLNGAMIAQDKFEELWQIWNTISTEKVFTKYSDFWVLVRLLLGKRSMYDLTPLKKLIEKYVKVGDLKKKFYAGVTDMESGTYHSISDFPSDADLQEAIYCSSVMPILWTPAELLDFSNFADGGLRNIAPLSDVIDDLPDKIYIICCQPSKLNPAPLPDFMSVVKRTLGILTNEVINTDLETLLTINDLTLQAKDQGVLLVNSKKGRLYKYFDVELIRPDTELGDSTDFSQEHIQKCIQLGINAVK